MFAAPGSMRDAQKLLSCDCTVQQPVVRMAMLGNPYGASMPMEHADHSLISRVFSSLFVTTIEVDSCLASRQTGTRAGEAKNWHLIFMRAEEEPTRKLVEWSR